jgi:D-amino-acid dehydrogenase
MSRIVVIGGGIIGLSTAYYSVQKGHNVTVVDRYPETKEGCSYGNAGMVVPSHFVPLAAPGAVAQGVKWMWNPESPFWIKPRLDRELISWGWKFWKASTEEHVQRAGPILRDMHMASRSAYEELAKSSGNAFGLAQKGLLMLCKTSRALHEEGQLVAQARQLGIPTEILNAAETSALDPNIRMNVAGSVYFPKDCHLSPDRLMSFLKEELRRLGVEFIWEQEVISFERNGKRIQGARTGAGILRGDEFAVCGGAWSSATVKEFGLNLPMQAGKGYSLTLREPRQLPEICAILSEARVAVTPMGSALRFGGTMEMAGLNEELNARRIQGIVKAAGEYYPEFKVEDFAGIEPWGGLRPCSPDGMPYLGRSGRYENLSIATGHAMMGVSLAPVTGKLMAQILSREKPFLDISQLNPERYA